MIIMALMHVCDWSPLAVESVMCFYHFRCTQIWGVHPNFLNKVFQAPAAVMQLFRDSFRSCWTCLAVLNQSLTDSTGNCISIVSTINLLKRDVSVNWWFWATGQPVWQMSGIANCVFPHFFNVRLINSWRVCRYFRWRFVFRFFSLSPTRIHRRL